MDRPMKLRTALVSAGVSLACVAGVVTGAPANAAPAKNINYNASVQGQSVVINTDAGSIRTANNQLQFVDNNGHVAVALPLTYKFNNVALPINASANGRTATLTPELPGKVLVDLPATRQERDQQALNNLGSNIGTAVTVGGLVGTIIGAVVGCIIGLPGTIPGCIGGAVTGAGIGGVAGTIIAGGPTLIGNVIEYFRVINSPFVPPKR
ncbi:MAG: glycine zipper family protein [Williamsia herbipolensis]|nr:glycine zipper family protein [Williamsia herbipolensis]